MPPEKIIKGQIVLASQGPPPGGGEPKLTLELFIDGGIDPINQTVIGQTLDPPPGGAASVDQMQPWGSGLVLGGLISWDAFTAPADLELRASINIIDVAGVNRAYDQGAFQQTIPAGPVAAVTAQTLLFTPVIDGTDISYLDGAFTNASGIVYHMMLGVSLGLA